LANDYSEIEAAEETNVGYKKAADLWSLGILTSSLFTGNISTPRQELAELSQVEIAARFLGTDDQYAREQWEEIPPRALRFIRRLLVVDPEKRMTVDEALDHAWYSKPPREAAALIEAIERINRFWKPRRNNDDVDLVEALPGLVINTGPALESPTVKFRKKVPDTSLSPYFGLDRHLFQRTQSTRKRILDDLNESGTRFVTFKEPEMDPTTAEARKWRSQPASRIISVEGTDLFGTSKKTESITRSDPGFEECPNMLEASPADFSGAPEVKRARTDLD
jgi:serine/threonine protein kinase